MTKIRRSVDNVGKVSDSLLVPKCLVLWRLTQYSGDHTVSQNISQSFVSYLLHIPHCDNYVSFQVAFHQNKPLVEIRLCLNIVQHSAT